MPLDRSKVMDYADKHWMYPCDDGFVYSYTSPGGKLVVEEKRTQLHRQGKLPDPDSWEAVFIPATGNKERACFIRPNPTSGESLSPPDHPAKFPAPYQGRFDVVTFHEDKGLVDCAHFVSRCVSSGGIALKHSYVPDLVEDLTRKPAAVARTLGIKVDFDQGLQILDTGIVAPGDIIAYWKFIEHEHRVGYGHSAVYTGKDSADGEHRITCHTAPRYRQYFFGENWSLYAPPPHDKKYTFIHFVDPEDTIPPLAARVLEGWFQIDQLGRKEFYQFRADGTCVKSPQAPAGRHRVPAGHLQSGYWFVRGFDAVVFWPSQGQVARFSIPGLLFGPIGDVFRGVIDGLVATLKRI
jgi:hypothetical protein